MTLTERRLSQLEQDRDALVHAAFALEARGKRIAAHRRLEAAAQVDARLNYLRLKLDELAISQAVSALRLLPTTNRKEGM